MIGKDDGANYIVFCYVCVEPGDHSTLDDYHAHEHGVIILHSLALVRLEGKEFELGPVDGPLCRTLGTPFVGNH